MGEDMEANKASEQRICRFCGSNDPNSYAYNGMYQHSSTYLCIQYLKFQIDDLRAMINKTKTEKTQ